MSNANEEDYYEEEFVNQTEYLKSPAWKNPIIDFIDEHCIVFDDAEENKLEYTSIHQDFKKLVESKLDKFMKEFGIPEDSFLVACQAASQKIHKSVINQILAVDNFLLFKKMMITRNKQFNEWAVKKLKEKEGKANQKEEQMAAIEREEAELQQAMAESKALEVNISKQALKEKRQAKLKEEKEALKMSIKDSIKESEPQSDENTSKKDNVFSQLPELMAKKAQLAGGFDDINIEESKEKKEQEIKDRQERLRQQRDMIRQKQNEERQKELQTYIEEKSKNKSEEEEKSERIKKGLAALKIAKDEESTQENRKNYMHNLRDALIAGGLDDDLPEITTKKKKKIEILSRDIL